MDSCIRVYEICNEWEDNGWWVAIVARVKMTFIRLLTLVMGHSRSGHGWKPEINPEMLVVWMELLSTWMNDRLWVISLYRMSNLKLTICASSAGSDNARCLAHKGSCTHESSSNSGDKYNKSATGEMNPQRWHPRPNIYITHLVHRFKLQNLLENLLLDTSTVAAYVVRILGGHDSGMMILLHELHFPCHRIGSSNLCGRISRKAFSQDLLKGEDATHTLVMQLACTSKSVQNL